MQNANPLNPARAAWKLVPSLLIFTILLTPALVRAQRRNNGREPKRSKSYSIPVDLQLRIVRAEDERRWDEDLKALLHDSNPVIRSRAALAAGRIGDEDAIEPLSKLLLNDDDPTVRSMSAFALGEIESAAGMGADTLLTVLGKPGVPDAVRARAVESLGKIAAAISKTDPARAQKIGDTIMAVLGQEAEHTSADHDVALLLITAALRARTAGAAPVLARFLSNPDARVRADAENALARLRSKEATVKLRELLLNDTDDVVRANAARALGAAEDKGSLEVLITGLQDRDERVRVSAIRSLGALKEKRAIALLLDRGDKLLNSVTRKRGALGIPGEVNEYLEIVSAVAKLEPGSGDSRAIRLLKAFRQSQGSVNPEVEIALATLSPELYLSDLSTARRNTKGIKNIPLGSSDWREWSSIAQGLSALAKDPATIQVALNSAYANARELLGSALCIPPETDPHRCPVVPVRARADLLRSFAAFKPENLAQLLRHEMTNPDVIVRAAAAELLGELPPGSENTEALAGALPLATHDQLNDAALAILDALGNQKSESANLIIKSALGSTDYLVRRRAVALLKTKGAGDFSARIGIVQPRNTEADYTRAISRIGTVVKATVRTSKGAFTIALLPDAAPLNVDNFIQLAKRGYFNGISFHRVVPNFVIQGGDPLGDGNGGPGYQIRCEINQEPFDRGVVGMALSGKDTGGSQWFVTHSPQPHLDGGYTVFGRVIDRLDIVDSIARGDKILDISIIEQTQRASKLRKPASNRRNGVVGAKT
jgi:cyclophilin family peptidyl-prolyl cis-trans isomerase/HEAT repeat protein